MLRLLLLRHAKAVPENAQDHSRALAPRGRKDAARMGQYMHKEQLLPDAVVTSDALRTQETTTLVMQALKEKIDIIRDPKIYLAEAHQLLKRIQNFPDNAKTCLMVGHNPGFHDVAQLLVGYGDRYAAARLRSGMPTCGLAVLDFDVESWSNVTERAGRLERFIIPADLEAKAAL
eukprot:gene13374-13489_t